MGAAVTQGIYESFFHRLRSARQRLLLLDYDGTLAPFRTERNLAFPYPEVPELITSIMASGTRVVFISGRPAQEIVQLSKVHPHPEIWGSHGLERLYPTDEYEVTALSEDQVDGLALALSATQKLELNGRTERKPGSVAVHWRGMGPEDAKQLNQDLLQCWTPLAGDHMLRVAEFDGGLEIRPEGRDKGNAVNVILKETVSDAVVAYLGDDSTDEDAFRVLKGKGLAVLVRPESRPSVADLWLKPPRELIEFLQDWLRSSGDRA